VFSEQTATFALYNINSVVFITEVESVYSAVRTESWYDTGFVFRVIKVGDEIIFDVLWSDFALSVLYKSQLYWYCMFSFAYIFRMRMRPVTDQLQLIIFKN
jgi:hypothetical protein